MFQFKIWLDKIINKLWEVLPHQLINRGRIQRILYSIQWACNVGDERKNFVLKTIHWHWHRHGLCDCYLNIYERGKDVSSHKGWQVFGVLTQQFQKGYDEEISSILLMDAWIESSAPAALTNKARLKLCKLTNLTLALNIWTSICKVSVISWLLNTKGHRTTLIMKLRDPKACF